MGEKQNLESVGEEIVAKEASWSFGGLTPKKFNEHVRRSVPYYEDGHELIVKLSDYFIKDGSVCYDLGTSTGKVITLLAERHKHRSNVKLVGIDSQVEMVTEAKEMTPPELNVELIVDDIVTHQYQKAELIVSYYTMQFVKPHLRQIMLNKIFETLNWGGAFIMFEKVRACDARFQDIMQTLYTDYKIEQGYSSEEIIAKTKSLKGILEPFSTQGNLDLLKRAGFVDIMTVFKHICFEGIIAIK